MGSTAYRLLILASLALPAAAQTDLQIASVQLEHFKHWGYSSVSWNPAWQPVSAEDVPRLEERLLADPEDTATRIRLLNFYWRNRLQHQRALSVFWLIAHHPESPVLGLDLAWLFPGNRNPGDHYRPMHDAADFNQARLLWDQVLPQQLATPEALHNAARFFESVDAARSSELAKRLQAVDPVGHGKVVSDFLTRILPALER